LNFMKIVKHYVKNKRKTTVYNTTKAKV